MSEKNKKNKTSLGKGGEEIEYEAQGTVFKVQPVFAEQNIFGKMGVNINEDTSIVKKILEQIGGDDEILKQPVEISVLVHYLLKNYTGTLLGQIIHPLQAKQIILDRLHQISEQLTMIVMRRIRSLRQRIENGEIRPDEDIEKEIETIIRMIRVSMIAIREAMNRMITMLHINSPATLRPPLANVKMGYDIL